MRNRHKLARIGLFVLVSFLGVTQAMAEIHTYPSGYLHMPIPDEGPGTMDHTIWVPPEDSFKIADVNVVLTIAHEMNSDLQVYLVYGGVEVELFTNVGGQVDNFENTTLDDEAAQSIRDAVAPCTGVFRPEGRLSDFDGMNAHGSWSLRVTDARKADSGYLESWTLIIEECVLPQQPTGPIPNDGATNVQLLPCLSWADPNDPETTWDLYLGVDDPGADMFLIAHDLSKPTFCLLNALEPSTQYKWQVVAKNPCGQTPGVCSSGTWRFTTTGPPAILCRDITVPADRNCQADLKLDDIVCWYDPCDTSVEWILDPSGPYPIGQTPVTVIATNNNAASASCTVTITVLPTAYCHKQQALCILESVLASLGYADQNLLTAIDYLRMSLGDNVDLLEDSRVFWAGPNRVAHRQGGFAGHRVFEFEQKACTLLMTFVDTVGAAYAEDVNEVWRLLAEADRQLADTAISDAVFHGAMEEAEQARTLRNAGNWAACSGGRQIPKVALKRYYEAWQKAVYGLGSTTDYNRDGILDVEDLLMFSDDMLAEMAD